MLQSWFSEAREGQRIPNAELEAAIAQMMLYAVKDGLDPEHPECKAEYKKMRKQVCSYNNSLGS